MGPKPFDLPHERLASTDETGARVKLYPADVSGPFRRFRTGVTYTFIVFFLSLPWIKIHGNPILMLDFIHRKFSFFGVLFRGDDGPILIFILGLFLLSIALITSRWGRIWCGWACPQTVFIDGLFRRIDRWIEGNAHSQRLLDKAPWGPSKLFKKTSTVVLYLGAAALITHSVLGVILGGETVVRMMTQSPFLHPGPALFILLTTLFIAAEFGIFREQFCIIACPYGRLQSVLQDDHTTVVLFDQSRKSDCVDCTRCVQVCPTGVDIRRGLQLECIQCTSCIDACDQVMHKVGKPKGLVRYDSVAAIAGHHRIRHLRSIAYAAILTVFAAGLVVVLSNREPLRVEVVRGRSSFQIMPDGRISNHIKIHIYNRVNQSGKATIQISPPIKNASLVVPIQPELVANGQSQVDLFIQFPATASRRVKFVITARLSDRQTVHTTSDEIELVRPE